MFIYVYIYTYVNLCVLYINTYDMIYTLYVQQNLKMAQLSQSSSFGSSFLGCSFFGAGVGLKGGWRLKRIGLPFHTSGIHFLVYLLPANKRNSPSPIHLPK